MNNLPDGMMNIFITELNMLDFEEVVRIRILNLEKYKGRELSDREKRSERKSAETESNFTYGNDFFLNEIDFKKILDQEQLLNYGFITFHEDFKDGHGALGCSLEMIVHKVESYYTLIMVSDDYGRIRLHQVFDNKEKLYYRIIKEMRNIKNQFLYSEGLYKKYNISADDVIGKINRL